MSSPSFPTITEERRQYITETLIDITIIIIISLLILRLMMDTILLLNEVLSQNLLWAEWVSFSACVSLFGILVIYYSNLVPEVISRAFKYGKAADLHVDGLKKRYHLIELPKR